MRGSHDGLFQDDHRHDEDWWEEITDPRYNWWDEDDKCLVKNYPTIITGSTISTPMIRGKKQERRAVADLKETTKKDLIIGRDNRVYEPKFGLIKCLAVAPVTKGEPEVYVEEVAWHDFPTKGQMARLYDTFFSKYDREVLMLIGRLRDESGWLYYVPEQEGSSALVKWTVDDEEMDEFYEKARWVGTIHVHPGNCCQPSQTDIDDWAEPEKSGLHLIFGRDGSYTVNGAIAGRTFQVDSGTMDGVTRADKVEYLTSKGRTLEELLLRPAPLVAKYIGTKAKFPPWTKPSSVVAPKGTMDKVDDFLAFVLDDVGAVPITHAETQGLKVVWYNGCHHILNPNQWACLKEWHAGVTPVPAFRTLRLRGA